MIGAGGKVMYKHQPAFRLPYSVPISFIWCAQTGVHHHPVHVLGDAFYFTLEVLLLPGAAPSECLSWACLAWESRMAPIQGQVVRPGPPGITWRASSCCPKAGKLNVTFMAHKGVHREY